MVHSSSMQETIAAAINNHCSITDTKRLSSLIEQIAIAIENPSRFPLNVAKADEVKFMDGLKRANILGNKGIGRSH